MAMPGDQADTAGACCGSLAGMTTNGAFPTGCWTWPAGCADRRQGRGSRLHLGRNTAPGGAGGGAPPPQWRPVVRGWTSPGRTPSRAPRRGCSAPCRRPCNAPRHGRGAAGRRSGKGNRPWAAAAATCTSRRNSEMPTIMIATASSRPEVPTSVMSPKAGGRQRGDGEVERIGIVGDQRVRAVLGLVDQGGHRKDEDQQVRRCAEGHLVAAKAARYPRATGGWSVGNETRGKAAGRAGRPAPRPRTAAGATPPPARRRRPRG